MRVVCLHGGASSGATWASLRARLERDGHRVDSPDLRGHGRGARGGDYTLPAFRDDILNLVGREDVALVGHSLGAHVATLVALARPDRITRLVLEEPPMPPVPPTRKTALALAAAGLTRRAFHRPALRAVIAELRREHPGWAAAVPTLAMPTLVIAGGPKSHIPQDRILTLADRLPAAELLTIPVGHRVHSKAPGPYADAVAEFLGRGREVRSAPDVA